LWRKQGGAEKLQEEVAAATRQEGGNGHAGTDALPRVEFAAQPSTNGEKPAKRLNPIKRKQMQERAAELEEEISGLEHQIAQCEAGLLNFVSAEDTMRLSRELDQHRFHLQGRIAEWEQIGRELEA